MDLLHFLEELSRSAALQVVDAPVNTHLEIAALSALAVRDQGPALLFRNARGTKHLVLTNALASEQRLALALNHACLGDFGSTASRLLQGWNNFPAPPLEITEHDPWLPSVETPPCRQHILPQAQATFRHLPDITLWPGDAGPCLTAAVVVTKHPRTGRRNAGIYRLQILGPSTATLGWHPGSDAAKHFDAAEELNQPLEVALALGVPPAVLLTAGLPLPEGVDELEFAARVTGNALPLAQCHVLDLLVPATSRMVLEGHALPGKRAIEGPFGNHTGLLSTPRPCPVFQLHTITQAAEPVLPCIVAGPPPSESTWMAKAHEAILRVRLRAAYPVIQDLALPLEGIYQNFLFVTLAADQKDALDLLLNLSEERELRRFRFLVAVDEAVNCADVSQVLWRLGNCLDPERDVIRIEGPLAPWHPSATPGHGGRLLLDARAKHPAIPMPGYPDPQCIETISRLWQTLHKR
ncbi:UbiD family decarboxylase [Desulfonatronum thioautotrophicum]|uniref:UbiD family decarboxylase n=1 Tax=Desulfonatronum thioautotrophicum TaxID=617001 RepID=UPI0005EB2C21|nr:UbiD family decarboxylase [Desulfonatronum thioautotrophicum]